MYFEKKQKRKNDRESCHNNDYNKNGTWRAAYYTLEASLIMPVVLCIIVMIIHLSYYMYQKAILAQDTYLLGFRAAVLGRQDEVDAAQYVAENAPDQFENRYIGSPLPRVRTTDSGRNVKLQSETEADHTAMGWHELMPAASWTVSAGSKADVIHRGQHIRRIDRIVDLGIIAVDNAKK